MKFHVYRSANDRQWRWRLVARNGKIIADSAEGYVRKADCISGIKRVQNAEIVKIYGREKE